jgi:hypothetical protein
MIIVIHYGYCYGGVWLNNDGLRDLRSANLR